MFILDLYRSHDLAFYINLKNPLTAKTIQREEEVPLWIILLYLSRASHLSCKAGRGRINNSILQLRKLRPKKGGYQISESIHKALDSIPSTTKREREFKSKYASKTYFLNIWPHFLLNALSPSLPFIDMHIF